MSAYEQEDHWHVGRLQNILAQFDSLGSWKHHGIRSNTTNSGSLASMRPTPRPGRRSLKELSPPWRGRLERTEHSRDDRIPQGWVLAPYRSATSRLTVKRTLPPGCSNPLHHRNRKSGPRSKPKARSITPGPVTAPHAPPLAFRSSQDAQARPHKVACRFSPSSRKNFLNRCGSRSPRSPWPWPLTKKATCKLFRTAAQPDTGSTRGVPGCIGKEISKHLDHALPVCPAKGKVVSKVDVDFVQSSSTQEDIPRLLDQASHLYRTGIHRQRTRLDTRHIQRGAGWTHIPTG